MPSSTDVAPPSVLQREDTGGRSGGVDAETFDVMGLRLHNIHRSSIVDCVVETAEDQGKLLVVNANAHCVTLSQSEA